MNKILLDTNILIYAKDSESVFHDWAVNVIRKNRGVVTFKNLMEYYAVVTKGERPFLSPLEAWEDIEEFSNLFEVIFPSSESRKRLKELIVKIRPKGLKIHDFEIASTALGNDIKRLATLNNDDFRGIDGLEIIRPKN